MRVNDYILLMHQDATDKAAAADPAAWERYITRLRSSGKFDGGSSIGSGERLRKGLPSQPADAALGGFMRVRAADLDEARQALAGNPVYEAGGTVEIRELPRS